MKKTMILAAVMATLAATARAAAYKIDPDHSSISFRVRHLAGHVIGTFDRFQGDFDYAAGDPKAWKTSATIDAASVDTRVAPRDKHLRSGDFFDAEKHPSITFLSTKITDAKGDHAKLLGKLTILDTTKDVVLDLIMNGTAQGTDGKEHAGFTATTRLNRKDFGLTWSAPVEAGGVLVGDDVDVTLEIEGIRQ